MIKIKFSATFDGRHFIEILKDFRLQEFFLWGAFGS
jgi:hypothetical protein